MVTDTLAPPRGCSGAAFHQHDYPTSGHLFADPDMPVDNVPDDEEAIQPVCECGAIQREAHQPSKTAPQ
jgi:hypothetical protein